jgi:hypothetical protein
VQCVNSRVENFNSKQIVKKLKDSSNTNLVKSSVTVKKRKIKDPKKESMKKIIISSSSLFKNFFTDKSANEVDNDHVTKLCFRDQSLPFKKYLTAKYQTDSSSEIKQNKRKLNNQKTSSFGKNLATHYEVVNNDLTPISVEFLTKQNPFCQMPFFKKEIFEV